MHSHYQHKLEQFINACIDMRRQCYFVSNIASAGVECQLSLRPKLAKVRYWLSCAAVLILAFFHSQCLQYSLKTRSTAAWGDRVTIGNPFVVAGLPRCFSDEDVVERLDKLVRLAVCFGLLIHFHLLLLCLTTGGHSQSSDFLSRCIQTDYYID